MWYLKELSQWDGSFEHTIHMIKLMDKKKITILSSILFIWAKLYKIFPLLFACWVNYRGVDSLKFKVHTCGPFYDF